VAEPAEQRAQVVHALYPATLRRLERCWWR
jgi:hypothetical protein